MYLHRFILDYPSMQAMDAETGVLKNGSYIKNPTAQNLDDLVQPGSNYVGNSQMNPFSDVDKY